MPSLLHFRVQVAFFFSDGMFKPGYGSITNEPAKSMVAVKYANYWARVAPIAKVWAKVAPSVIAKCCVTKSKVFPS